MLRIASDATFPPFHWVDEAGRTTGFDIELARAVAPGRETQKTRIDEALARLESSGEIKKLRRRFGVERDPGWPVSW